MNSKEQRFFKIGDLSRLFHIGVDSIRYYEKIGLLHPLRDTENNYRLYTIDDVRSMNTIRELLELGFSTDEILAFENDRRLEHVTRMLDKESTIIDRQIEALNLRKGKIKARLRSIREAQAMPADGQVRIRTFPVRQCMMIIDHYMPEEMINYQVARFTADMPGKASTIGACDCYTIDLSGGMIRSGSYKYKNVFFYSPYLHYPCNYSLPAGTYLSLAFRGSYHQETARINYLLNYVKEHRLQAESDVLEFCHIDRFETMDKSEYVTEFQIKTAEPLGE